MREAKSVSRLCIEALNSSEYKSKCDGGGGNEENVSIEEVDNKVLVDSPKEEFPTNGVCRYSAFLPNRFSSN